MPTLPVELWWDILRRAVHIPGQFDTKWDYSPDSLIWDGWKSLDSSYSESLKTKLSICRVSRTWRTIGVESLYEHLLFTDDDITRLAMFKLGTTFWQHEADQSGYGRSTKRLEVHGNALEPPYYRSLCILLDRCYNIRIFNVFDKRRLHRVAQSELSSILQNRFSHSLRRIRIQFDKPSHGGVRLPNVPLDSLEVSTGYFRSSFISPSFANVTSLCIDFIPHHNTSSILSFVLLPPSALQFPALRHLTLHGMTNDWVNTRFLRSLMSIHGPRLHSLHLTIGDNHLDPFSFLPDLLAPALTLRCLAFPTRKVAWRPTDYSFPSITHIGFQSSFLPAPSYIEEFVSGSIFPSLQCIRFLDISNTVVCMDPGCNWVSLLDVCRKRDIRIEDKNYKLLRI